MFFAGFIMWSLFRIRQASWRKDIGEIEKLDQLLNKGERVLVVFWHGKYLPLFSLLAGRKACMFTTPSFRGAVIAETCRRFGYDCVILPAESGRRPRASIIEALRDHAAAALVVDGPLGPRHKVKRGAIDIGAQLGFSLLPVSAAARRCKIIEKRWDKREIPRMFTKVAVTVGDPIGIPSPLAPGDIPLLKKQIHDALEALGRRAAGKVQIAPASHMQVSAPSQPSPRP